MSLFCVKNLSSGYGNRQILYNVSLEVQEEETILLIGANGSGKSTLLKSIYRLLPAWENSKTETKIDFNNINILAANAHELTHKGLMYIPQKNELFTNMTVQQNLETSLLHFRSKKLLSERLDDIYSHMPSLYNIRSQKSSHLSGGERKTLSLSMAFVNRPLLLLLDEPLAGIANDKINEILGILIRLKSMGTTLIIAEHRIKDLFDFATRIIGLREGRIVNKRIDTFEKTSTVFL